MEVQIKDNKIYAPLKDKWLVVKPEEEVRQRYIYRLADSYGYDLKQMDQELKVTNSQRGQGAARADIVIWKSAKYKADSKLDIQLTHGRKCSFRFVDTSYWRNVQPLNGFAQTKSAVSQPLLKSGGANLHQECTYGLTTVQPPK